MKTVNFLLRFIILSLAVSVSFLIIHYYNAASVLCCQGVQESTLDNLFWKIEETNKTNIWHVLFRNVGIKYEVAQCQEDTDTTTMLFEFRQIGPNYRGLFNPEYLWQMRDEDVLKCWAENNQAHVKTEDGAIRLTGSTDPNLVFTCRHHNNIVDASMEHFNSIQRGEFHPNAPNSINPNSHGRGTNVLGHVNNTFGTNSGNTWPSNNSSQTAGPSSAPKGPQGRGIRSPLDQFLIRDWITLIAPLLANLHLTYTNMGFYLTIATLIVVLLGLLAINYQKININGWFISMESVYATAYSIVVNQINRIKGQNFYPFLYCLLAYILVNNLIGMIPYSFAPTSHFILTFFISFSVVLGCTFLGFVLHRLGFFSILVPSGCPLGLLPLLVLIEFISFLARNVSLGLRLAANILSGHMLLNILSEFTYSIMETNTFYFFLGIVPIGFISAFSGLEFGIAFIQAQVFTVLSSSYISDSLILH